MVSILKLYLDHYKELLEDTCPRWFLHLQMIKKWKKKMTHENYIRFHFFSIFYFWNSAMLIHSCTVYGIFHTIMSEVCSCDRLYHPQNLNYLFSVPLQKRFTDICIKHSFLETRLHYVKYPYSQTYWKNVTEDT